MLATIHDDTWNLLNMQHTVIQNSKRWDYTNTPGGQITHCPWMEKVVHWRRWIWSLSFQRKNTNFSQIYHQNPAHLCVSYIWFLRDTKRFVKTLLMRKWRMWRIPNKKAKGVRDFCLLGDWDPPTWLKVATTLETPPTPTHGRSEVSPPNSFGGEFILWSTHSAFHLYFLFWCRIVIQWSGQPWNNFGIQRVTLVQFWIGEMGQIGSFRALCKAWPQIWHTIIHWLPFLETNYILHSTAV